VKLYFGIIDPFLVYSLKVNWIDFVLALVIIIYINNIKAVQLNVLFSFVLTQKKQKVKAFSFS